MWKTARWETVGTQKIFEETIEQKSQVLNFLKQPLRLDKRFAAHVETLMILSSSKANKGTKLVGNAAPPTQNHLLNSTQLLLAARQTDKLLAWWCDMDA